MRMLDRFSFVRIGVPRFRRDAAGCVVEYTHALPDGVVPNRYAAGPFCTFELPDAPASAGVYALVVGNEIRYVGECKDLRQRFGFAGYGHTDARNCHSDGQATNCKINGLLLETSRNEPVEVWFTPSDARKELEAQLITECRPPWNGRQAAVPTRMVNAVLKPEGARRDRGNSFEDALEREFLEASRGTQRTLRIRAGDLHAKVGGYPGPSHRMPSCCKAMRAAMMPGDSVIQEPPSGIGANLVVEYQLPRRLVL